MIEIRTATVDDALTVTAHREAMFAAMGRGTHEARTEMSRTFLAWVRPRLEDGRYLGWLAGDDGHTVGGAGLLILDWPPVPADPTGVTRGYLMNVWVEPEYRRQGLARRLVELCMKEARQREMRIVSLHASDEGRPLYESLGFEAANEMQRVDGRTGEIGR